MSVYDITNSQMENHVQNIFYVSSYDNSDSIKLNSKSIPKILMPTKLQNKLLKYLIENRFAYRAKISMKYCWLLWCG